jgi:hypothetical protein
LADLSRAAKKAFRISHSSFRPAPPTCTSLQALGLGIRVCVFVFGSLAFVRAFQHSGFRCRLHVFVFRSRAFVRAFQHSGFRCRLSKRDWHPFLGSCFRLFPFQSVFSAFGARASARAFLRSGSSFRPALHYAHYSLPAFDTFGIRIVSRFSLSGIGLSCSRFSARVFAAGCSHG